MGSSASRTEGFPTRARASTTRCCSPPDSSPARCDARARKPHLIQPRQRFGGSLRVRPSPNQQRHHHVFLRRKLRQQIVNLPNKPNLPIAKIRLFRVGRAVKSLYFRSISYPSKACPDRLTDAAAWTSRRPTRPPARASPRAPRPGRFRRIRPGPTLPICTPWRGLAREYKGRSIPAVYDNQRHTPRSERESSDLLHITSAAAH